MTGGSERPEIEVDREADGRWIAEIIDVPGVLAYGATRDEAIKKAENLFDQVLVDRQNHGESISEA